MRYNVNDPQASINDSIENIGAFLEELRNEKLIMAVYEDEINQADRELDNISQNVEAMEDSNLGVMEDFISSVKSHKEELEGMITGVRQELGL